MALIGRTRSLTLGQRNGLGEVEAWRGDGGGHGGQRADDESRSGEMHFWKMLISQTSDELDDCNEDTTLAANTGGLDGRQINANSSRLDRPYYSSGHRLQQPTASTPKYGIGLTSFMQPKSPRPAAPAPFGVPVTSCWQLNLDPTQELVSQVPTTGAGRQGRCWIPEWKKFQLNAGIYEPIFNSIHSHDRSRLGDVSNASCRCKLTKRWVTGLVGLANGSRALHLINGPSYLII